MTAALTCHNLKVAFSLGDGKKRVVLNELNATFPAGKISIVSGAIGAGKSTLLNVLAGLLRPTSGEVRANDQAVSRWMGVHRDRWRQRVGIIFQHHHLLYGYTVLENIMLPLIPWGRTLSACRRKSIAVLQQVDLLRCAGDLVNTLSGGEKQKTAIARALVTQPLFVLADEPTAHQDDESAEIVLNLLDQCAARKAVVIVATHETQAQAFPGKPLRFRLESGILNPLAS